MENGHNRERRSRYPSGPIERCLAVGRLGLYRVTWTDGTAARQGSSNSVGCVATISTRSQNRIKSNENRADTAPHGGTWVLYKAKRVRIVTRGHPVEGSVHISKQNGSERISWFFYQKSAVSMGTRTGLNSLVR